ncbi:MAG: hypothetical protein ACXWCW_26055, partial [Burkholderiales bacterium]
RPPHAKRAFILTFASSEASVTMNFELLIRELSEHLQRDIEALGTMPDTPTGHRTARRLSDVADHAPGFMSLLVEPLVAQADRAQVMPTLLECARVHLYARVLDDALDDNLPLDRRNLLRIQPRFWRAVYTLGARHPEQLATSLSLVEATVEAVETDDRRASPAEWGRKNFHLLLAPLLLSGESPAYRSALPGLSALIAVAQACEEVEQGALRQSMVRDKLTHCLVQWLDADLVGALQQFGWQGAAERLVADGEALLARMM